MKISRLVTPTRRAIAVSMLRDGVLAVACFWLALLLRFDGDVPAPFHQRFVWLVPYIAGVLVLIGASRGLYGAVARYTSVSELFLLAEAVAAMGISVLILARYGLRSGHYLPLSVPIMGSIITFLVLGVVRLRVRLTEHLRPRASAQLQQDRTRVLIVGAGNAGELVCRDMLRASDGRFQPVAFLDDDPEKLRRSIHGVPVLGDTSAVADLAQRLRADLIVVAMPSAPSHTLRPILDRASESGVKVKIVPSLEEMLDRPLTSGDIRDVDIADLLGRDPVNIDVASVAGYLSGRVVLVTGAAGSIGSELSRQVARFNPSRLILLDHDESDVYSLWQELSSGQRVVDGQIEMVVGDVRDLTRMKAIFEEARPDVVFHAAAQKQVPVMERFPTEAINANVVGTHNVATLAGTYKVERFVLVSTDKAVDPASVMGATKRIAELVVRRSGERFPTKFASVRFGNVLGSRGSVVPIFAQQIRQGGPITITHPDVTRFFMTIPEAAALIIQAGAIAEGGETFILDMGEAVKIVELANRMIALLADPSRPVGIRFIGLRPGERLHETLWRSDEDVTPTTHERILRVAKAEVALGPAFDRELERLSKAGAMHSRDDDVKQRLFAVASGPALAEVAAPAVSER